MADFSPFNRVCPHCGHAQTITKQEYFEHYAYVNIDNHTLYPLGIIIYAVGCANKDCKKISMSFELIEFQKTSRSYLPKRSADPYLTRSIIPESNAKPQPDYIPSPLIEDYYEACNIRDLSPKAAATLARRCLQGMIRDFCGIKKDRLVDEIKALRKAVDDGTAPHGVTPDSVDAIDNVWAVGNIGAHMEKEIDLIVQVDPGEAQILIELIEALFEEWYVARLRRKQRFESVKAVAAEKKKLIADGRAERAQKDEIAVDAGLPSTDSEGLDTIG